VKAIATELPSASARGRNKHSGVATSGWPGESRVKSWHICGSVGGPLTCQARRIAAQICRDCERSNRCRGRNRGIKPARA